MTPDAAIDLVSDPDKAVTVLHPLRLAILQRLGEPRSASSLAREMNLPRQKINYHLRELERKGFLELVEERRKGNCTERILKARAQSYLIDPSSLGTLSGPAVKDRFSSSYLVAVAGESIKEVAVLRQRADRTGKILPTFTLQTEVRFARPTDLQSFTEDLTAALSRLVDKYTRPVSETARRFKLNLLSYPAITKPEGESS